MMSTLFFLQLKYYKYDIVKKLFHFFNYLLLNHYKYDRLIYFFSILLMFSVKIKKYLIGK